LDVAKSDDFLNFCQQSFLPDTLRTGTIELWTDQSVSRCHREAVSSLLENIHMKRLWALKPNLLECILEDRICPAISNLGLIVLTTSGLTLTTPFPGASNSASSTSVSTSAASVSGAAFPTSIYITGNRGISTFSPGNFTGNPNVGGAGGIGTGGVSVTIQVGSGADEAGGGPANTSTPSRTNGGNGTLNPVLAVIGGTSSSGGGSPTLPAGQTYGSQTAPVAAPAPFGMTLPASNMGGQGGSMSTMPLNPGAGAPTMMPGSSLIRMPTPVFPGLTTNGGFPMP
jgi:hypothetical protein